MNSLIQSFAGGDMLKGDYNSTGIRNTATWRPKTEEVRKSTQIATFLGIVTYARQRGYRVVVDGGGDIWYLKGSGITAATAATAIGNYDPAPQMGKWAHIV